LVLKLLFFFKIIQIFFFVFQAHLVYSFFVKNILIFVSILSILFGSIAALFESKLKKIIAFSSTNQLGFVFLSLATILQNERGVVFYFFIEIFKCPFFF